MPKERFFNLDKSKREHIINAAIIDISNHCYNEVSINRIVKNANISRGSFYDYFEDKEDLILYILKNYKEKIFLDMKSLNKEKNENVDIFIKFKMFIYNIVENENLKNLNIIKNILNGINEQDVKIKEYLSFIHKKIYSSWIENDKNLNLNKIEDREILIDILICLSRNVLNKIFANFDKRYDYYNEFEKQMEFLKRTYTKNEK